MSFYNAPYSQPYTSNRGMTLYPEQQYAQNVAYYTPRQQNVGGGRMVNSNGTPGQAAMQGGGGLDFSQFFQTNLNGGGGNGQQAAFDPRQLSGRAKSEYQRAMARGNSPFRSRSGGGYSGQTPMNVGNNTPAPYVPPATTNPQTPAFSFGNGATEWTTPFAQVDSGITAGAMPQGAMQNSLAAFQSLLGGQGGTMGGLMAQYGNRAGTDMERAMTQQGAQMDLTAQQARSQGNLDKMNLLYNNQRESVLNDVAMRNLLVNLFSGLAGGFA